MIDLSPGWDAVYRAKTNSKKRNLHKRRRRQLGELGEVTTTTARRLDELEEPPDVRRPVLRRPPDRRACPIHVANSSRSFPAFLSLRSIS